MKLSEFQHTIDFPTRAPVVHVVYVLFHLEDGSEAATPFYVGQTGRFSGRMTDYGIAAFAAATDFKVGEAIKHLRKNGMKI